MKLYANRLSELESPIVPASQDRDWMSESGKRCLPLRMANGAGWWILNPARFEAVWSGASASTGVQYSPEASHIRTNFGDGILTVLVPYVFQTPPGWNLLARGPANLPKDGIHPLEGLVETDWNTTTFTMNWKFTAPDVLVTFEAGEPLCQIVPMKRGELESFKPRIRDMSGEALARYRRWEEALQRGRRRSIPRPCLLAP